jgi:hypothetical protein
MNDAMTYENEKHSGQAGCMSHPHKGKESYRITHDAYL